MEQNNIYNAMNICFWDFCAINSTAVGSKVGLLNCPSDSVISKPSVWEQLPSEKGGDRLVYASARTSYAANIGVWPNANFPETPENAQTAQLRLFQYNGIVGSVGYPRDYQDPYYRGIGMPTVHVADVTDGLANTIALMERRSFDTPEYAVPRRWIEGGFIWSSAWLGHALGCVYTPVNYFKAKRDPYVHTETPAGLIGASSMHPGGANVAFADGSVRFLRETIDSWTISPTTGLPPGVSFDGLLRFHVAPGTRIPILQALGSRNGGEVVSSDDF